ncbi:hypothetical protein BX666DRAFT_2162196 [Dichotomocladium elegans]|nr:hypothetical protein BX666DRAFT_2162196 [Dichotomocladium elegans]
MSMFLTLFSCIMAFAADHSGEKIDLSNRGKTLSYDLHQLTISQGVFQKRSSSIQQLLLCRNELESLEDCAKEIHSLRLSLRELSLRDNCLSKLPVEIFPLAQLTSLSLASNRLESIAEGIFPSFPHLQWLGLSGNKLSNLPDDLLKCVKLKGLDVHNNCFTAIPPVVSCLARLEVLLVHRNQIHRLPEDFTLCDTLQALNLSFNFLREIPLALIRSPPPALAYLYLSGNPLKRISPLFLQSGYSELVTLDLHTCQITALPPVFFSRLSSSKLRRLNLAINMLTSIPEEVGLIKSLEWLNLNDNRLVQLPSSLSNLTRLVKLGLVQNRLRTLPEHLFSRMHKLQKLDIRRNRLLYFPSSLLAMVPLSEASSNVDVAAPIEVFHMSTCPPSCSIQAQGGVLLCGGSLRTLLCAENPDITHLEGIVCRGIPGEAPDLLLLSRETVMTTTYPTNDTEWPQSKLNGISHIRAEAQRHHRATKMERAPSDDDYNMAQKGNDERSVFKELTKIISLREICIRVLLNKGHGKFFRFPSPELSTQSGVCLEHLSTLQPHLAVYPEECQKYLEAFIPRCIPHALRQIILVSSRQCDYCRQWYSDSRLQIAYVSRICSYRHLVPIRFEVCSLDCAFMGLCQLQEYRATRTGAIHTDFSSSVGRSPERFVEADFPTQSSTRRPATDRDTRDIIDITRQYLSRAASFLMASLVSIRHDETLNGAGVNERWSAPIPAANTYSDGVTQGGALTLDSAMPATMEIVHFSRDAIRLEKF